MSQHQARKQAKSHSENLASLSWWKRQGYRSKPAEFTLYFLCASGLALWDGFQLPWAVERFVLVVHFLVSLLAFPLFVFPFWQVHRGLMQKSKKPFLRNSGRIIEYLLYASLVSGLYLSFFGNRGEGIGQAAYWAHLLTALPIALLVLVHALRWSMLKRPAWALGFVLALLVLAQPAWAVQESGSFIEDKTGGFFISANFDTGSISRIDAADGTLLSERTVGTDIRRIALGDGILAATDYGANELLLLRPDNLQVTGRVALPKRPFGVVWDKDRRLFWVAVFETRRLVAVSLQGEVIHEMETAETPRGLALLEDGRLLVSHAMTGEVSIYDTAAQPPRLIKLIKLHETQNADEFVSQGVPRLLDDIAVSPDGTEAWLPHVLWNFDHPFQFQSTVFPSVSLVSLAAGKERELPDRRKHLFKQINVVDGRNRTRIVSNPHDAEFSADGKKLYVTLAGSEDLMVFDLSRRKAKSTKKRRARRKGKLNQGGAKVVQILRHLPGGNPRGLIVNASGLYVQNAMSLDVSRLDPGRGGSFSRVKVSKPDFARLVSHDPVQPDLRAGRRLFHSGNTDKNDGAPMAGDFWMSCQSCHLDGFNFTTGYLFRDSAHDKYDNAVVGHKGLGRMIAGDFVGDYIRIIQGTQGGLGAGLREDVADVDPASPEPPVREMMEDLHLAVTERKNLPLVSSWLRFDGPEAEGFVDPETWGNSADCAECHSQAFADWSDSLHRLMGESNPYYNFLEDVAAGIEGEEFRQWCMGCHMPQNLLSGQKKTGISKGHMFEKGGKSLFEAMRAGKTDLDEGTGCFFCHRITDLEAARGHKAGGNASFTVNTGDREVYALEDSKIGLLKWAGSHQINAKPGRHADSYSQPFYKESRLCSSCHNEFAPGSGSVIVDTYGEWEKSSFNAPDDPSRHRSCIDCHMTGDIARIGEDVPGITTDGGRMKENAVTHNFTGANHFLVGLRNERLERMSIDLLKTAAELELSSSGGKAVTVRVKNTGAGHALPTGVADFRQLWLQVRVADARGRVVLDEGLADADGNLPKDTRFFRKVFGDKDGKPVVLAFWRYEKMLEDTKVPADGYRDETFQLPDDTVFPIRVESRLMFRIYPQWVTDAVRGKYPDLPNPPMIEMTSRNAEFTQ